MNVQNLGGRPEAGVRPVDKAILALMLAQLLILDYLTVSKVPRLLMFALMLAGVVGRRKPVRVRPGSVALLLLTCVLLALNLVGNGVRLSVLEYNLTSYLQPLACMAYLAGFVGEHRQYIVSAIKRLDALLNIYYFATVGVAFLQFHYHVLVAATNSSYSASSGAIYWMDVSSGLFRFSGTHVLCLFTVFIILYNLWRSRCNDNGHRIVSLALMIGDAAVGFALSLLNGNRALHLVLPLALLTLFLPAIRLGLPRVRRKSLMRVLLAVPAVAFLISWRPVRDIVGENVLTHLEVMANSWGTSSGSSVTGMGQRVGMVYAALARPSTWLFGMGLGAQRRAEDYFMGFRRFGLSDAGVILLLLGAWLSVILVSWYSRKLFLLSGCVGRNRRGHRLALVAFFIAILIYTRVLSNFDDFVAFALVVLAFGLNWGNGARNQDSAASDGPPNASLV